MASPDGLGPTGEHRTVSRVMSIIELVVASEAAGVRLGDLSQAVDAPKSSIHGLAKGLVATGYLREEDGRYLTGPAISSLLAVGPATLPAAYHHALEGLTSKWRETSMLATLVGDSVVYLDIVEPETTIRASPPLNKRQTLWPKSGGKALLAFMEPKRVEGYLRRQSFTPSERDQIKAELASIRESRVAVNDDVDAELCGIASPIQNGGAPVTTAIAMAGPAFRMREHLDEYRADVLAAAERLSNRA
jgi:DNA-binding IclR family transcriptional regulator